MAMHLYRGGQAPRVLVLIGVLTACLLGSPTVRAGGPIVVNTPNDELNNDGDCSLREAIMSANRNASVSGCTAGNGADTVMVPAGTFRLTRIGVQEQNNVLGDLDVRGSVTIVGAGTSSTFLDGNGTERILDIYAPSVVTIRDLTIQNGAPAPGRPGGALVALDGSTTTLRRVTITGSKTTDGPDKRPDGGAIYTTGNLKLINSLVTLNCATGLEGSGGGIWNGGKLTLTRSSVTSNCSDGMNPATHAIDGGGGIYNEGTLVATASTIASNDSRFRGGGIANVGTATVDRSTVSGNSSVNGGGIFTSKPIVITNSTISGNSADKSGGGIWSSGANVTVSSVTIAKNRADDDVNGSGDGGGIFVASGTVAIWNSLLALNVDAQAPSCRAAGGTLMSKGWNHIDQPLGCTVSGSTTGNQLGGAPKLGPLADNGGPTLTHALLSGSPDIDAGNPAVPGGGALACPTLDQRGVGRPKNGDASGTARCDRGAYELDPGP